VEGLFIAGAVIATLQFVRLRDRRLVPLAFFLAFLAGVEAREEWERSRRRFQLGAVGAGLALAASTVARGRSESASP
jgi:hypothetical protein